MSDSEARVGDPHLYLASKSPRRRQLLTEAGLDFSVVQSGVDDSELRCGQVTPGEWVVALAYLKAAAAHQRLPAEARRDRGEAIVLGADTLVVKGDRLIGQPRNDRDAERTVRLLQDGSHMVITGVALVDSATGLRATFFDAAQVHVGRLEDAEIVSYVESGQWQGRAGAYNLAERLEAGWPIEYEGDPGTVMGLPMRRLRDEIERFTDMIGTNGTGRRAC